MLKGIGVFGGGRRYEHDQRLENFDIGFHPPLLRCTASAKTGFYFIEEVSQSRPTQKFSGYLDHHSP